MLVSGQQSRGPTQTNANNTLNSSVYTIHNANKDQSSSDTSEASCLYALITSRRSVSRRNRASWYLRQLNKVVKCDPLEWVEQDALFPQEEQLDQQDAGLQVDANNQSDRQSPLPTNDEKDIFLVSIVSFMGCPSSNETSNNHESRETSTTTIRRPASGHTGSKMPFAANDSGERFLVTPNTKVLYLSKSIATSIILDLSPSVVSVSPQNDCVFLDSMFDALKRVLHLLVKEHEFPSSQASRQYTHAPKVFVSVIAYTPFVVAKNNQVLVQNRRISSINIEQVLVELWLCLNRLIQELHELVTNACGISFEYENNSKMTPSAFVFAPPLHSGIIRHPGSVLDDIYELGLFSAGLMPRLSRLSIIIITDGLFSSSNNLNVFRLRSIAVSFVSLATESIYPDACFGYTTYNDLMRFVAKSTQGVYISHNELIRSSCSLSRAKSIPLLNNPLYRLFSWTLHSDMHTMNDDSNQCVTPKMGDNFAKVLPCSVAATDHILEMRPENIAKLFCIDQPVGDFQKSASSSTVDRMADMELISNQNYHDWRSFKQMSRNLDADFEQVLSCLLREGYLIKSVHLKHRETSTIVARLVLYWKHNLNLEQELQAPYWNSADSPFELNDSSNLILKPFLAPSYGDTYCEMIVHGSYNFLHDFYCDKKVKRRSDYRTIAYQQFEHLILGVKQTYDKLQYLSSYYRNPNLSKVPSFLLHGNSLLFEQPHTHNLTSTIDNVVDKTHQSREFSEYWQEISQIELRNWKNLMHIHSLRLILEHDQPKHKNIHCQNANGRYAHIQCRRAMSAISNFIKSYASFALLEDSLYIKFIHNKDDDLRDIETSATKGFIVIRIKKLLPIVVIYLMFTSGILDSHRVQIVNYIENQLVKYKLRSARISTTSQPAASNQSTSDNILKSKIIYPSGDSCCMLVRSPLERMLRVYSRNMIGEFLAQNLTHGLPGACPYSIQQQQRASSIIRQHHQQNTKQSNNQPNDDSNVPQMTTAGQQQHKSRTTTMREQLDDCSTMDHNSLIMNMNRYNPVFGKYLYGIRVVHTLSNLPYELVHQIVLNVLAKISAILVNVRIKQGFHIAFNNSGLLTLVTELAMKDYSHEFHSSNCLCQYLIFPPTVTNCCTHGTTNVLHHNSIQNGATISNIGGLSATATQQPASIVGSVGASGGGGLSSKPDSLSGSLANSDQSFMKAGSRHDAISSPTIQGTENQGEIKVIREYWIEQQYGISIESSRYHRSLENMRYSEVVDHLYLTDTTIFNCLLTYDLLQLLCDKMSPFYDLDLALSRAESRQMSLFSPTTSTSSSNILDPCSPTLPSLPSALIEGTTKDGGTRIPLIELDYRFSVVRFLDYCQFASLDVLLFKDSSAFYEPTMKNSAEDGDGLDLLANKPNDLHQEHGVHHQNNIINWNDSLAHHQAKPSSIKSTQTRKMSVDVNNQAETPDQHSSRREHRSSYDSLNVSHGLTYAYVNPILSHSLNHLFMETLHKRLKQIHDKELRMSELDRAELTQYLKRRKIVLEAGHDAETLLQELDGSPTEQTGTIKVNSNQDTQMTTLNAKTFLNSKKTNQVNWRCYMRKGNQENLMIVLVPASLADVTSWMVAVESLSSDEAKAPNTQQKFEHEVCPMFVFRCSCTMINDQVLAFLSNSDDSKTINKPQDLETSPHKAKSNLEADLNLHFGQPCNYMTKLRAVNDELYNEILPLNKFSELSQGAVSDEKTLELIHFRAFLRKIKNTVLKSRFSSLNDAYLSELFVHKDDILYYINNVDLDTQKKYHVSSHLKNLAEFIRSYEEYHASLPKEPAKPCNQLLNSILLQKCGLFINQPIARFDEANPLMKQLHDRKLLHLMRCNYKIELPILEENLSNSTFLRKFVKKEASPAPDKAHHSAAQRTATSSRHQQHPATNDIHSPNNDVAYSSGSLASSLGRSGTTTGSRLMEMKCGSIGSAGMILPGTSPSLESSAIQQHAHDPRFRLAPRFSSHSSSNLSSILSPSNDSFYLEAFKNSTCPIDEVLPHYLDDETSGDVCLRHEAHMAEALKRKGERKESHHYRRVLKSKGNYNQSHSAIDQALKRVDSLGRLEHFCLTPLLFSPAWRSKLAPVRDHTIEASLANDQTATPTASHSEQGQQLGYGLRSSVQSNMLVAEREEEEANERWHQMICNNYIKEYEQYIQTLGFNSVQIRFPSGSKLQTSMSSSSGLGGLNMTSSQQQSVKSASARKTSLQVAPSGSSSSKYSPGSSSSRKPPPGVRKDSSAAVANSSGAFIQITAAQMAQTVGSYNTGYLIKFLNSGCLVFKVGFCKPYVYSILYSIEGERFNNSNVKMNMTAFLDELDNIKVTLHLHSFTYDYHLRSMYSYISRRQINLNPGYHLISFADDFRKYYQKAPNYARNHILSGEVNISNLKIDGQQLYNYIVTHNHTYQLEVLEMTVSSVANLIGGISTLATTANERAGNPASVQGDKARKAAGQQFASFLSSQFGGAGNINQKQQTDELDQDSISSQLGRNHANDYVLIELKREKVRYKDGKEPDVFDCGLIIAHDHLQTSTSKNSLVLKYFLILTNQRDLYPKLVHVGDSIISLGCHRPIRLGLVTNQPAANFPSAKTTSATTSSATMKFSLVESSASNDTTMVEQPMNLLAGSSATTSGRLGQTVTSRRGELMALANSTDTQSASEFLSSGELSGPQSIISTVNSVQSLTNSTCLSAHNHHQLQFVGGPATTISDTETSLTSSIHVIASTSQTTDSSSLIKPEEAAEALAAEEQLSSFLHNKLDHLRIDPSLIQHGPATTSSNVSVTTTNGEEMLSSIEAPTRPRESLSRSPSKLSAELFKEDSAAAAPTTIGQQQLLPHEQTICDEEITYLGYFSSDEMDMLRFLQEKTANLKSHVEQIVRQAEVHFRRDYLWHRLMQRQTLDQQSSSIMGSRSSSSPDQLPLTVDELVQLLSIVEAIDLATLDPNLATFTTMHITWYIKLLKTFNELKQNPACCLHRIYTVKASKILLLYIDPKCTTAFILLSINQERGSVELSMLLKDRRECCTSIAATTKTPDQTATTKQPTGGELGTAANIELDTDCQQLISDFINFCATFMWSNLLT